MQGRLRDIVNQHDNLKNQLNEDVLENRRIDTQLNASKAESYRYKKLRDAKIRLVFVLHHQQNVHIMF